MAETDAVTLGEVIRRLDRQDETLGEIRADVKRINGSLVRHETSIEAHRIRLEGHDRELRDLKRSPRSAPESGARSGIVINVPTDGKTIAALLLALVTIGAALIGMFRG